ncbi:MAG: CoA ester lyase [Acidimicrobiia bacterium]|nr:CoA ester lyase [Acidimicrobiia bacterium]
MAARSFLFVPGDRPDMLAKATKRGADALIIDLEDAVAPSAKQQARETVSSWLAGLAGPVPDIWVRLNHPGDSFGAEILAVPNARVTGVMIPKVSTRTELEHAANLLDDAEIAKGLPAGSIRLLPIIETAAGMLGVGELGAARRVSQLMIGELDLSAELGIDPANSAALLPLRMQVVVASAALGLEAPLGPVSPNFTNLETLRNEAQELASLGFGSRPAIHPVQVPVYNEVFGVTPGAVARARKLVALYDAALAEGRGAVTDDEGHMVDEAVVRLARRVLDKSRTDTAE